MNCSFCGAPLERPGDLCLVCGERNVDVAAVFFGGETAEIRFYSDGESRAAETVTASFEGEDERGRQVAFRNFVSRAHDLLYRRRPDRVFAGGRRDAIEELRGITTLPLRRVPGDFFESVEKELSAPEPLLEVMTPARQKFGGPHSSLVGGREGMDLLVELAGHRNVKKVIPAAISAKGTRGGGGVELSVTRVDDRGNLKALLKSGSSVQEVRIVTTASSREEGRRVAREVRERMESEKR